MTPVGGKKINDLAGVKEWIAEHDGRTNAWWSAQHKLNEDNEEDMKAVLSRITSVERKVIWFTGLAAGLGALIGTSIVQIVTRV